MVNVVTQQKNKSFKKNKNPLIPNKYGGYQLGIMEKTT
jgi:hypothetical protein